MINSLLQKLNITNTCSSLYEKKFPSGNMFIARTNAIRQLLDYPFTSDDFPEELGQLNGTLQHIIEFIWFYIVNFNNYTYKYCKYKKTL